MKKLEFAWPGDAEHTAVSLVGLLGFALVWHCLYQLAGHITLAGDLLDRPIAFDIRANTRLDEALIERGVKAGLPTRRHRSVCTPAKFRLGVYGRVREDSRGARYNSGLRRARRGTARIAAVEVEFRHTSNAVLRRRSPKDRRDGCARHPEWCSSRGDLQRSSSPPTARRTFRPC